MLRGSAAAATLLGPVVFAGFVLGAITMPAFAGAAGPGRIRLGHPPRLTAGARTIGALAPGTTVHVTVVLRARDPAALAALARDVSTPGTSMYRHYLTAAEFARRFGATARQLRAVESSLRAHGLTPGVVTGNRLSIELTASAARIDRAFSLSLRRIQLPGGLRATVASAAPALDAAIAGDVQAILGLSSLPAPRPLTEWPPPAERAQTIGSAAGAQLRSPATAHLATGGPQPCAQAGQTAQQQGAYTADQIASAYGFSGLYGSGDEGQSETIGIYELEPDDPSDIATYQACYGTSVRVSYVKVDGGAGTGPGSGEAALDIEQAIGLAPRASIIVYQGPNATQANPGSGPYDTWSAIVSQDRAQVITNSWGQCEQLEGSADAAAESTLFEEAAVQGQSILSAAGDEGSEDCNGNNGVPDPALAVDDPASQPFVTGVGGTTLSSAGPPPTEEVWNSGGSVTGLLGAQPGAGGGGVSQLWRMPGYQSSAAGSLHVIQASSSGAPCGAPSGYCREVPDVSADADPRTGYVIYYNGSGADPATPSGWQAIGGTSAAAPVWAALLADADSSPACHGSPIGFANPALYRAADSAYAGSFHDVTVGENDFTGTNGGLYPAGTGYDMASGLGTPDASGLASALCTDTLRVTNPGPQTSTVGQLVRLRIRTTAPPGTALSFAATGLPAGLSIGRSSGRIAGRPTRPASSTVTIAALGSDLSLRGATFHWTVRGRPTVSRATLAGVGTERPKLALTITAGRYAPELRAVALGLPAGLLFAAAPGDVTVTATGGIRVRFGTRLRRGRLMVTFFRTVRQIRLTVGYSAIAATGELASRVRARRTSRIELTVVVTDAARHATTVRADVPVIS